MKKITLKETSCTSFPSTGTITYLHSAGTQALIFVQIFLEELFTISEAGSTTTIKNYGYSKSDSDNLSERDVR